MQPIQQSKYFIQAAKKTRLPFSFEVIRKRYINDGVKTNLSNITREIPP